MTMNYLLLITQIMQLTMCPFECQNTTPVSLLRGGSRYFEQLRGEPAFPTVATFLLLSPLWVRMRTIKSILCMEGF